MTMRDNLGGESIDSLTGEILPSSAEDDLDLDPREPVSWDQDDPGPSTIHVQDEGLVQPARSINISAPPDAPIYGDARGPIYCRALHPETGEVRLIPKDSSIEDLLWLRSRAVYVAEMASKDVREIEGDIQAQMYMQGIEDLDNPEWVVTLKPGESTYNKTRLMAMLPELVNKDDYAGVYTAAYDEPRPDKHHEADIHMGRVKGLRKRGQPVKDLIEECRTPGPPVLKISRLKQAKMTREEESL